MMPIQAAEIPKNQIGDNMGKPKKDKSLVVSRTTTKRKRYRSSEVIIQLPPNDTDVTLRLPNGQLIDVQFRVEQPSIDFVLPENCAVTNWQGDDMEAAKAMRAQRGQGSQAHVRLAKQLAIPLNPNVLHKEPRGWVYIEDTGRRYLTGFSDDEVGFAEPDECQDGEDAVRQFNKEWAGDDFSVFFRDSTGALQSVSDESTAADYE